jgi:hypothetical protein
MWKYKKNGKDCIEAEGFHLNDDNQGLIQYTAKINV